MLRNTALCLRFVLVMYAKVHALQQSRARLVLLASLRWDYRSFVGQDSKF